MAGGGQPGNQNARKGRIWSDAIREYAIRDANGIPQRDTPMMIAVAAIWAKACEGDVPALKEIGDRIEGKVPQQIVGPDDGAIQLDVTISAVETLREYLATKSV